MLRILRPKVELGSFARQLLADTYSHIVTMKDPAGELDTESAMSVEEREIANREFYDFKFAVVFSFLFIKLAEGKLKADPDLLIKHTLIAFWLALRDIGLGDERAKEEAIRIGERFESKYNNLLYKHDRVGSKNSLDFTLCLAFSTDTLKLDLTKERDREKNFVLFSMAKNLLKLAHLYADEQFSGVNVVCTP